MSAQEESSIIHTGLSELELRILDFEASWWRYAGAKEAAIKELFELSAARYYQLLNDLIDRDDALAASPMLVKRLRRLREARMNTRTAR
ncbi:MAG: hypothetical protein RJA68_949 [Actinomycetota bacterium]|jgi:hypothetical protein